MRATASAPWIVQRSRSTFSFGPHSMPRAAIEPREVKAGNHFSPASASPVANRQSAVKTFARCATTAALQARVQVSAAFPGVLGMPIIGGDIDATGETDAPVRDEDFAVIAQVDGVKARGHQRGIERSHRHARAAQRPCGGAHEKRASASSRSTRTSTPRAIARPSASTNCRLIPSRSKM